MLAQELFSGYNQMRLPPRCALKVDIRKAYDTVEWDFLLAVLQLFGFPTKFTRWIEECVSTTSFSIGLNEKPHGFFTGARGLRQGDPLSPYWSKKLCDIIQCDRTSIWVQWLYPRPVTGHINLDCPLHPFLRSIVDYQIGNGGRFFVWQDPWHHLGPLIERFPRGPRHLRLEESAKLSSITHNLPLILGGEDRVIWRCDEGQPTTQTLYRLFDPPEPKLGWSSLLSGSLKIPRHSFILWLAILGKLPTTDKSWLSPLGVCILCDERATESHSHLFFRCRFSRQCLFEIRRWIRFHWPNRDWVTDIEWPTRKWRGKHIINSAYRTLLASCVYHIWSERNLRRFEHTERTPATLSILIVDDVRQRILSVDLASSVSTRALYRLWRIPWVEGETI
ncbi:UNVERIFIED_CONTAM: hypothetical protein Sindi_1832200 [Sesamum indicum]